MVIGNVDETFTEEITWQVGFNNTDCNAIDTIVEPRHIPLNTDKAYHGDPLDNIEFAPDRSFGYAVARDLTIEAQYRTTTDNLKWYTEHRIGN